MKVYHLRGAYMYLMIIAESTEQAIKMAIEQSRGYIKDWRAEEETRLQTNVTTPMILLEHYMD